MLYLLLDEVEAIRKLAERVEHGAPGREHAQNSANKRVHQVEDGTGALLQVEGDSLEATHVEEGRVVYRGQLRVRGCISAALGAAPGAPGMGA